MNGRDLGVWWIGNGDLDWSQGWRIGMMRMLMRTTREGRKRGGFIDESRTVSLTPRRASVASEKA